jgi:NAD(P)-dependent dehydrogenase (short-subunit alcohol dehydrogenase family)
MSDRVTLITGASAGIVTELARLFASKGHRLAMVDRRGNRLITLATEIAAPLVAPPILIPCDLEHPDARDEICRAVGRGKDGRRVRRQQERRNLCPMRSMLPPGETVSLNPNTFAAALLNACRLTASMPRWRGA